MQFRKTHGHFYCPQDNKPSEGDPNDLLLPQFSNEIKNHPHEIKISQNPFASQLQTRPGTVTAFDF